MATPQSTYLTNALSLHQTLTDFLTVAIHTILYSRALYPPSIFISTRKYNLPVRQCRHPAVCDWINSSVSHIATLLKAGTVKRIIVVIYNRDGEVMERFLFDVERFPVVESKEYLTDFEAREGSDGPGVSRSDVEEQLRATIRKLAYAGEKLSPLPEGCTFTIAVELRDKADPPIGVCHSATNKIYLDLADAKKHPQPWIPSEPSLQIGEKDDSDMRGADVGGVKSTPVRLVEAGEFILEAWVEEGRAKYDDIGD